MVNATGTRPRNGTILNLEAKKIKPLNIGPLPILSRLKIGLKIRDKLRPDTIKILLRHHLSKIHAMVFGHRRNFSRAKINRDAAILHRHDVRPKILLGKVNIDRRGLGGNRDVRIGHVLSF